MKRPHALAAAENDALIERVEGDRPAATVVLHAVDAQQAFQQTVLADDEVGGTCRLFSLLSEESHADGGVLDHRDVVAAVADRQNGLFCGVFQAERDVALGGSFSAEAPSVWVSRDSRWRP